MIRTLQFVAMLFAAVAMAAGWAHLSELPNKMTLAHEDYLMVQQIFRGWASLGFIVVGALVATAMLTVLQRGAGTAFYLALAATLCIALSLAVFFLFTFPANKGDAELDRLAAAVAGASAAMGILACDWRNPKLRRAGFTYALHHIQPTLSFAVPRPG